ncbi:MAG: hypothetical protein U0840_17250 [Gemmataceae bacterium]
MKRFDQMAALAGGVVLLWCLTVQAGKVRTWTHHRPADHEKARFEGTVISSEGSVRLARPLRPLGKLDAMHVWAVAEDAAGRVYAATGDEGKVYRFLPDGTREVVYAGPATQVLSLAVDERNGIVYAGTGPDGTIVRIDERGAKVVCRLEASYVWALTLAPGGDALYAATGPHGRIYRVTPEGRATVFFETKQDHVMSVALTKAGVLLAGTDRTGRVYRITGPGKGTVVHQAMQTEVRTLLVEGDVVYAGTSATKLRPSAPRSSDAMSKATSKAPVEGSEAKGPFRVVSRGEKMADKSTESDKRESKTEETSGSAAAAPSAPTSGENSVLRIAADGTVRELFRGKVLVLSLARLAGRLVVGTGMKGELLEVDEVTREKSVLTRLEHGQILSLARRKDGTLLVGTGDMGQVYTLDVGHAKRGTVVSDVLDARQMARWGALRWRGEMPAGTRVEVATRSGPVAEPDDTWSEWSAEERLAEGVRPRAPAGRYLQYRLTLTSERPEATPVVRSLALQYATANQAPEVTKLEVPDVEGGKKIKLKWSAEDANEDELRYSLYVMKDGWTGWVLLDEGLTGTDHEWDTTKTASGTYRVKVVASDAAENGEAEGLSGERISEPFVVCHTPPTVTIAGNRVEAGRVSVMASATSPLVRLASAAYAVDGKKWVNVVPTDGLFDTRSEQLEFRTEGLKPGTHVLVLRVKDVAGNIGTADVVFTVK